MDIILNNKYHIKDTNYNAIPIEYLGDGYYLAIVKDNPFYTQETRISFRDYKFEDLSKYDEYIGRRKVEIKEEKELFKNILERFKSAFNLR